MSAFKHCQSIEEKGVYITIKYLEKFESLTCTSIEYDTASGKALQHQGVDLMCDSGSGKVLVEVKTEQKHTGNFFMEEWSNLDKKLGWLHTCQADAMAYVFLGKYFYWIPDWKALQAHVLENISSFKPIRQDKYKQTNVTVGRLVPIQPLIEQGLVIQKKLPEDSGN